MILSSLSRLRQPQNTISRATTALRGSRPWWVVVGPVSPLSLDAHISSGEIVSFFYWLWVGSSSSSNLWSWKSLRCTELTWSCNFMAYNCHFMLVIFFFWIWFSSHWLSVPNLIPLLASGVFTIYLSKRLSVSFFICMSTGTYSIAFCLRKGTFMGLCPQSTLFLTLFFQHYAFEICPCCYLCS